MVLPNQPIDVKDGAYFIWPINLDMDGVRLTYATAQPLARLDEGAHRVTYVFAATPGLPVELAFAAQPALRIEGAGTVSAGPAGGQLVQVERPGLDAAIDVQAGGRRVRVLVLTPEQARRVTVSAIAGQRRLVLSDAQVWFDEQGLQLRSTGHTDISFAVYPALEKAPTGASWRAGSDGLFQRYSTSVAPVSAQVQASVLRPAGMVGPVPLGGRSNLPVQPYPQAFKPAAAWTLRLNAPAAPQVEQYLLRPDLVGDVARLFSGTRMVDDWYYAGYGWDYSLGAKAAGEMTLQVLPLRADAPIYLPKEARPDFGGKPQLAELRGVTLTPVYQVQARILPQSKRR